MSFQSFDPEVTVTDQIMWIQTKLQEIVWRFSNVPPKQAARLIDDAFKLLKEKTHYKTDDLKWIRDELLRQFESRETAP